MAHWGAIRHGAVSHGAGLGASGAIFHRSRERGNGVLRAAKAYVVMVDGGVAKELWMGDSEGHAWLLNVLKSAMKGSTYWPDDMSVVELIGRCSGLTT